MLRRLVKSEREVLATKPRGKFARAKIQSRVGRMTNWQRARWAAAGYPTDSSTLAGFLELKRPAS